MVRAWRTFGIRAAYSLLRHLLHWHAVSGLLRVHVRVEHLLPVLLLRWGWRRICAHLLLVLRLLHVLLFHAWIVGLNAEVLLLWAYAASTSYGR